MAVYRLFTEKKAGYDVYAKRTEKRIKNILGLDVFVRYFIRYDIEGMELDELKRAEDTIFSEPPVDNIYRENLPSLEGYYVLAIEYLPGQYDQRADSAAQCVQLLTMKERPTIRCANVFAIRLSDNDANSMDKITKLLVNPVECRQCSLDKPLNLQQSIEAEQGQEYVNGFIDFSLDDIRAYHKQEGLAMSEEDLLFVKEHFSSIKRNPTLAELKVIDTYWSDHCRHTTFLTELSDIEINSENPHIEQAFSNYKQLFIKHNGKKESKYHCLMDIATIGAKELKRQGRLRDVDESEEINACSINVTAKTRNGDESWLVMFKNETHNHPTEIEPFGGAATCLGGAIRDPLSGRAYAYQAMRVSGAGDINQPIDSVLKGKLPQEIISTLAAQGFSSYGNQIGLATGMVHEFFHEGFVAKRMEVGFVVAAARKENVVREIPKKGDIILLIGGETGRDGCGGATGSSKAHDFGSIEKCGAEVQKGNPVTERKLQRLFRDAEFARHIKRCNDFGAGGVSVAIGELADALEINLNNIPKKYQGLNAIELAISESQERMAIVIDPSSFELIREKCAAENVSLSKVATVTDSGKMVMLYNGEEVVSLSRDFLNTNGIKQSISARIEEGKTDYFNKLSDLEQRLYDDGEFGKLLTTILSKNSVCSQKGLVEMFDSTIGAGTVLMPLGGKYQLTPSIAMAAKLPLMNTTTATVAAFGYNPYLLSESCFIGAVHSVLESVIKVVIAGGKYDSIYLSFQEYFEKLRRDASRWGKPTSALLGALTAQLGLGLGAIGGKDSMSGSFESIDVPPTLISFAIGTTEADNVIVNTITKSGERLYRYAIPRDVYGMPDLEKVQDFLRGLEQRIENKEVGFATIVLEGGACAAVAKSCFGNGFGFDFINSSMDMFTPQIGDIIISTTNEGCTLIEGLQFIGESNDRGEFTFKGSELSLPYELAQSAFCDTFERAYPTKIEETSNSISALPFVDKRITFSKNRVAKPRVLIPTFPGTNCENDTARKFIEAGGEADIFIVKNLSDRDISQSIMELKKRIERSNIVAFPGGFSGGDEPDGSGKFIATTFRNQFLSDAINDLLYNRDGLMIGICNGFQALIKLGLLPDGKISLMKSDSATLTFNDISRHVSQMASIKVFSTNSPWFNEVRVGDVFSVAVSHGEGKFVANEDALKGLIKNGQVATRYVNLEGRETMQFPFNPNGSIEAIEGIFSPDGRILGKMGHSERSGEKLFKNVPTPLDMGIFSSGIKYFK